MRSRFFEDAFIQTYVQRGTYYVLAITNTRATTSINTTKYKYVTTY